MDSSGREMTENQVEILHSSNNKVEEEILFHKGYENNRELFEEIDNYFNESSVIGKGRLHDSAFHFIFWSIFKTAYLKEYEEGELPLT